MDDVCVESTIGERIRRLRNDALMTQDGLAAAAGVSTDMIRKLEQGRRHTASIGTLYRIARALGVELACDMEMLGKLSSYEGNAGRDASVAAHARRSRAQRQKRMLHSATHPA